jgi:PAS domain S-box-containing protein
MIVQAFGLAFLEVSFLFVILMLLHTMKRQVGSAPFNMALAAVVVMTQVVAGLGIEVVSGLPGLDFALAPTAFMAPLMGVILVLYIIDGTTEAQRVMLGICATSAVFVYLAWATDRQLMASNYKFDPGVSAGSMQNLLFSSRVATMASLLSILVEFLALPIVFQLLRNRNCRLSVAVFGALFMSQVLDAFFYELVTNYDWHEFWEALRTSYLGRLTAMAWVGALTVGYLRLWEVPARAAANRSPFEIVTTVMDRYGPGKRLQAFVRDWEGRYQMVVENTNDCIFIVGVDGNILDANKVAAEKLGISIEEMNAANVTAYFCDEAGESWAWKERLWPRLYPENAKESDAVHLDEPGCWMMRRDGSRIAADVGLTAVKVRGTRAALVVARDVTVRHQLEEERAALQGQLVHSQRMEAVGQLAGGVAHDFNNLLHAMQGNLDLLEKELEEGTRGKNLAHNINTAAERAARLTEQMLGFARGGKYDVQVLVLGDLLRQTADLFEPMVRKNMKLRVAIHPDTLRVNGDFTQLEQVVLNLLINARDALSEVPEGRLTCRVEPAAEHTPGWDPARGNVDDFAAVRVKDNGPGIADDIREKIFEPFFTTKERRGTGMGLAMAYGCVANHNGWIHVECPAGKGTEFVVFLPLAGTAAARREDGDAS